MTQDTGFETLLGRRKELRRLMAAIERRSSQLICGRPDTGKTTLLQHAIAGLPEAIREKCICWSGPASGRELVSHLVAKLYSAGDAFVSRKVHADGGSTARLNQWLKNQSALRLRGILYSAATRGDYRFFLDEFPSASLPIAKLMKEIIYRCRTPIYLAGSGYSSAEIGFAWSLYWTDEYRIQLGPLPESAARALLEASIRRFGLEALELERFREEILSLSGLLPGAIVKMCELAADARYHYGNRIKTKVVHIDYLMRANAPGHSWQAAG